MLDPHASFRTLPAHFDVPQGNVEPFLSVFLVLDNARDMPPTWQADVAWDLGIISQANPAYSVFHRASSSSSSSLLLLLVLVMHLC